MKTVIMAGGRGTRISSLASDIPKPMIPIGGKPVLEHELECLRDQGFTEIILTVGHLGSVIMDYFGDGRGISPATGKPFGVSITYYVEKEPLGNAGALLRLKDQLTEDFLLLNGDAMFDVDFHRFVEYHKACGGVATLFTHPNSHPYDSGLLVTDQKGCVTQWLTKEDPRPEYYRNCVNAGLHVLSPKVLDIPFEGTKVDLDRQILKPLAGSGSMYAYTSPEYVKDMGTPERYESVRQDYLSGKIQARNLKHPQKAIFLDRDGTINQYVGFLRTPEEFVLLPRVAEAIRIINQSGYLAILVTNQPVIARGEVTEQTLRKIHDKMETLLGKEGAYLDAIFYCPHHPHKGYEGEVPELKIDCDCRKPKPGMLKQAEAMYGIDLKASWMVGDSQNDILAGAAAGCRTALVSNTPEDWGQTITVASLLDFANALENEMTERGETHEF